ncbi:glycine betaine/L-proline ABC transporter ATP-binding protein [Candidatus Aerophobetes bacterium]|nr:glycine betaine/L-proline ABC transporter ATP-binding protein [Candidatus Aerophobetes bacterium]
MEIRLKSVYKIFGKEPQKVLELLKKGKTKSEIYEETGQVVAVNDVSLDISIGETFVVMGLSGSGKSTLLRCINRLVDPTLGKIYSKELEITSLNQRELREIRTHNITMVFQHFALFPRRRVLSNITFGLEIQKKPKEYQRKKALEMLELVGLKEWSDSYPSELSGGMKQRIGLARALATEAKILLMDEPFSALDPLIRLRMQEELLKLQNKLKRTVFFVTHDLDEALRLGGRIAIMEEGGIVQVGSPEEIIINPRTEYVANFVKNADPSGVLTAAKMIDSATKASFVSSKRYLLDHKTNLTLELDEDSHPIRAYIENQPLLIKSYPNIGEGETNLILVPENTVLRDIMKAKVCCDFPLVVVSREKKFKGIITEKDILKTLLMKGKEKDLGSQNV